MAIGGYPAICAVGVLGVTAEVLHGDSILVITREATSRSRCTLGEVLGLYNCVIRCRTGALLVGGVVRLAGAICGVAERPFDALPGGASALFLDFLVSCAVADGVFDTFVAVLVLYAIVLVIALVSRLGAELAANVEELVVIGVNRSAREFCGALRVDGALVTFTACRDALFAVGIAR